MGINLLSAIGQAKPVTEFVNTVGQYQANQSNLETQALQRQRLQADALQAEKDNREYHADAALALFPEHQRGNIRKAWTMAGYLGEGGVIRGKDARSTPELFHKFPELAVSVNQTEKDYLLREAEKLGRKGDPESQAKALEHASEAANLQKLIDKATGGVSKLGEPAGIDTSGRIVYKSERGLIYSDQSPYTAGKQLTPTTLSRNVGQRNPIGLDPSTKETVYQDLETMGMVRADGSPYTPKGSLLPLTQSPFANPAERPISQAEKARLKFSMRKEFEGLPVVKDHNVLMNQLGRMEKAIEESRTAKSKVAVDQALITIYNKMMDPTSVVRESEYARTPSDQALLSNLQGRATKILEGGAGLTDAERQALISMARNFGAVTREMYGMEANYFRDLARDSGIEPDTIVKPGKYTFAPTQGGSASPAGTPGATIAPAGVKAQLPSGRVVTSDGKGGWR